MESRQSRMNKYYDEETQEEVSPSRIDKHKELYKEVSNLELEDFDLNSNASVIGNNNDNINLDEIKSILSKKYHVEKKDKSFGSTDEINLPKINLDETREYDLSSMLRKAKENKEFNYEEDRLKRLRNTQYDILKNLDIMNKDDEVEEESIELEAPAEPRAEVASASTKEELRDLIDTITAKELIKNERDLKVTGDLDPLDLLSDLRGDDDSTKVMGMIELELREALMENTNLGASPTLEDMDHLANLEASLRQAEKEELDNKDVEHVVEDVEDNSVLADGVTDDSSAEEAVEDAQEEVTIKQVHDEDTEELDDGHNQLDSEKLEEPKPKKKEEKVTDTNLFNSFIEKGQFTQSDFEDFNDLKKDMKVTRFIVKLLIILLVILIIGGLFFILNKQLGWELF